MLRVTELVVMILEYLKLNKVAQFGRVFEPLLSPSMQQEIVPLIAEGYHIFLLRKGAKILMEDLQDFSNCCPPKFGKPGFNNFHPI
ncbi:hypothetical protein VTN96DRAFT_2766 [Rasamsonia emersonii]